MITLRNSKVLITGAAGFVGTNLIRRLVKEGANVTGTVFKRPPQEIIEGVKYINVDLTRNEDCLSACSGQEYVFMCAANSSGAAVIEKKPLTHLTPNLVMNAQMLEAAYANGIKKFVFISSNTVYPVALEPVKEEDISYKFFEKYHIVGWMKTFSEEMCKMYNDHIHDPMKVLIIRPGNLYGPYDKYTWNESKVVAALIRRFAENQNPLEVWGDGKDIKDFLYIDDFIEGMLKAFKSNDINKPINIASGKPTTITEVIDTLKLITKNKTLQVNYDSTKPSMLPVRLINTEYAQEKIGWIPTYSLEQGLRITLNWYLDKFKTKKPENYYDNL